MSPRHAARLASRIPGARRLDLPRALHAEYALRSDRAHLVGALEEFLASRPPGT